MDILKPNLAGKVSQTPFGDLNNYAEAKKSRESSKNLRSNKPELSWGAECLKAIWPVWQTKYIGQTHVRIKKNSKHSASCSILILSWSTPENNHFNSQSPRAGNVDRVTETENHERGFILSMSSRLLLWDCHDAFKKLRMVPKVWEFLLCQSKNKRKTKISHTK